MIKLSKISIAGYKSIRNCENLELGRLNVLIGANGSGKSNFISFFKLLNAVVTGNLQLFVAKSGGARSLLHFGPKITSSCNGALQFEDSDRCMIYKLNLLPAISDTLIIDQEELNSDHNSPKFAKGSAFISPHRESGLAEANIFEDELVNTFKTAISQLKIYQFHDTSETSPLRSTADIAANRALYSDGGNLPAILRAIRETNPNRYLRIVETVRMVAPYFHDFILEPRRDTERNLLLNWERKGSEYEFGPHQLSDGTLRFIALATLLLQPPEWLPPLIIIDEPELGLHPYAIQVLVSLMEEAAFSAQLIVATQSASLVDEIEPQNVVIADQVEQASVFKRVEQGQLTEWLNSYSLGQLWLKNVLDGGLPQ